MKNKMKELSAALMAAVMLCTSAFAIGDVWWPAAATTKEETCTITFKKGGVYELSPVDLEYRLGIAQGELKGITITKLPAVGDGILMLADIEVDEYDYVPREKIHSMYFVPIRDITTTSFTFIPECDNPTVTTLNMNFTEDLKASPKVSDLKFATMSGAVLSSAFDCYDVDMNDVTIKITQQPTKGELKVSGMSFSYEPYPGETGKDRFSYCAVDSQGNYSSDAVVNIDLEKCSGTQYADMAKNPSAYAAVKLSEAGLMTGEKLGGTQLFYPERSVSRGELMMMLLAAKGYDKDLAACVNTGLDNDSEIPMWLKPYVASAMENGLITESSFQASGVPTNAEAVVMVNRASGVDNATGVNLKVSDAGEIPDWATQSYMNLSAYGMLSTHDGSVYPTKELSRAGAADLVWALCQQENASEK
ncbi:Ig-like domain-containing protein [Zongyangia hominis]|uniref:Ig-like domain-containing protein n=1 Tax=Zongyangia hominis TaxID=2763677 RepID=A0A926ED21_9FIRM|nr:Ig-like domain-containing protein [Zongyangia hominis]MBC8570169.1 Ig-like domain-containing protein [Zongyangia hominis]